MPGQSCGLKPPSDVNLEEESNTMPTTATAWGGLVDVATYATSTESISQVDSAPWINVRRGADYLYSGDGHDVILGQNGADTLDGGAATSTLWCNDVGSDQVVIRKAGAIFSAMTATHCNQGI
jgi:Ca2+-binding RTX toxin-like protein